MDRIQEMLSRIAELSGSDLDALESAIVEEFETVEGQELSQQVVETLESLAEAAQAVRGEKTRRAQEQEVLEQKAAEAAARIRTPEGDEAAMDESEDPDMDSEDEEDETPEEDETDEEVPVFSDESPSEPESEPSAEAESAAELSTDTVESETELSTETETPETADSQETPEDGSTELAAEAEEASAEVEEAQELSDSSDSEATEAVEESVEAAEAAETTEAAAEAAEEVEAAAEAAVETPEAAEAAEETEPEAELSSENTETPVENSEPASQENVEATVTAAADSGNELPIEAPASHQPVEKVPAAVTITAGADIPGYTAGTEMSSMGDVAQAFIKRLHGLRRVNGGDGEQHTVATLNTTFPEDRFLSAGDANENWEKIQNVVSPQAITASGGYCAPLETRYEVFSLGSTARPVRDSLAGFGADRGGIRYVEPPVLADYSGATEVWTAANDESPSAPATKPCLTVACGSELTATADAITLCLQFGNLATRAYPEMVARHNELALIQHAREAEQNLLTAIAAAGTAVTAAKVLGVARDFLVQIDKAAAAYRYRHRLDPNAPLRIIAPAWVGDAIRADLAMQVAGDDSLAVADAKVNSFFSTRNVNVTWSIDGQPGFGAQGAGALGDFPATFQWDIFAEGTFLFLDGGTLDLGVIRDSTLVGTNDYKMFVETFEGVAKVGVESLHVTSTFAATGEAQAAIDAVTS